MRLETKVTVIKKSQNNLFLVDDGEEKKKVTHHIVQSLEVTLSENCRFVVYLQRPITFQKFGRTTERIIREINKNLSSITFLQHSTDFIAWWYTYSYAYPEITYVFYLGSADLERIKFSGEQRKIIKRALDGNLKSLYTRNPSKPKSDMEYRKRAYYGKCKK
jgi:hypothetical protein